MTSLINSLRKIFKKKKKRSVVFFRHNYYHFYYLAKALRKRGWDAISVNLEDPNGINANYYHGEDINLYSPDPEVFKENITKFFAEAKKRFDLFHFTGDGYLCFFPELWIEEDPKDILEWRSLNKKVAYTISGCNSATAKSSVIKWSELDEGRSVCDKCVWALQPEVCNDQKNLAWGKKLEKYCDLIFSETLPALDYIAHHPRVIRDPVTMCLNNKFWKPNLSIPRKFRIDKKPGELLVYHAVGNYESRNKDGRNIKGTPAVFAAIERLKAEGLPVKLIFVTNMQNKNVRYIQSQADVIVDQLNYGRYGSTAREGMMLGKPVICYINHNEYHSKDKLACLNEVPLVSATEDSIYEVLKSLLLDADKRRMIGEKAREYAVKWHSAEKCAEKYEEIFDNFMNQKEVNFV